MRVRQYISSWKNKVTRKQKLWKIIDITESIINLVYKIIAPFIPAIVIGTQTNATILTLILFVGGVLRVFYSMTHQNCLKDVYGHFKWITRSK